MGGRSHPVKTPTTWATGAAAPRRSASSAARSAISGPAMAHASRARPLGPGGATVEVQAAVREHTPRPVVADHREHRFEGHQSRVGDRLDVGQQAGGGGANRLVGTRGGEPLEEAP
ncbi:MAG: hypothetical protein ACRD1K_08510 [Acidimicrobiales bacterium]